MIVQHEFLSRLKDFGLNSYEAKLWTALLSRGVATAGELSDVANVPRSRSYDVLESLEKKGFVMMKLGKPIKYIAVPPSEVIDRVKQKIQEESTSQTKMIDGLRTSDILVELTSLHTKGIKSVEPGDLTGAVKGRDNLYTHLITMIKDAKKNIYISTTEDGLIRKAKTLKHSLQKAKDRGVVIAITAPITNKNKDAAAELSKLCEIRPVKFALPRCIIIDDKQIAMMVMDDNGHPSTDFGVWVDQMEFTQPLANMFATSWKESSKKAKA